MRRNRVLILFSGMMCLASCEQALINSGQGAAANLLKDPSSAQFRNVRTDGDAYVCGEINVKNSFGAYNGFSEFYAFQTVDGDWMATIHDERQIEELPVGLRQITMDNFRTAQARCDNDEQLEQKILNEQMQRMCDDGNEAACDITEVDPVPDVITD